MGVTAVDGQSQKIPKQCGALPVIRRAGRQMVPIENRHH